jgi:predicted enzyme related to lactoylglutathione lyase
VAKAGGKVVLPVMSIGKYGKISQFIDSEGNRVALHSR